MPHTKWHAYPLNERAALESTLIQINARWLRSWFLAIDIYPSVRSCLSGGSSHSTGVCRTFTQPVTGRRIGACFLAFGNQLPCLSIEERPARNPSMNEALSCSRLTQPDLCTRFTWLVWTPAKEHTTGYLKVSASYVLSLNSFQVPLSLFGVNP
jgi:hypothetical protein